MTETLFMHIGLPKTGTTSLQVRLRETPDILYVHDPDARQPQSRSFANSVGVGRDLVGDPETAQAYLAGLKTQIAESAHPVAVISDETLSQVKRVDRQALVDFLRAVPGQIRIVMVVRPFLSWAESLINQFVKNGNFDFHSFSPRHSNAINAYSLDIRAIHDFYANIATEIGPRARVEVLKYDSDIAENFSALTGITLSEEAAHPKIVNRSPQAFRALEAYARSVGFDPHKLPANTTAKFIGRKHAQVLIETHGGWIADLSDRLGWPRDFLDDSQSFFDGTGPFCYLAFGRRSFPRDAPGAPAPETDVKNGTTP